MTYVLNSLKPIHFLWRAGFYLFLFFQFFVLHEFYQFYNYELDQETVTDTIVVFTGGENRVCTAVALFEKNLSTSLYISGLNAKTTKDQVLKAAQCRLENLDHVVIDYAKNTEENVHLVAEWIKENKIRSIRLVTGAYHLPRAILLLSAKIPDVVIIPHGLKSKRYDQDDAAFPFIEFVKFEYAYLIG